MTGNSGKQHLMSPLYLEADVRPVDATVVDVEVKCARLLDSGEGNDNVIVFSLEGDATDVGTPRE